MEEPSRDDLSERIRQVRIVRHISRGKDLARMIAIAVIPFGSFFNERPSRFEEARQARLRGEIQPCYI